MKRATAILLALLMSSAGSVELTLSPTEAKACAAEGGCDVVSRALLARMLAQAHRAGMATCESRI